MKEGCEREEFFVGEEGGVDEKEEVMRAGGVWETQKVRQCWERA
jgi:hypothetical protein